MQNQRELFEIKRGGRRITVAVRGARGRRRYIGSIDGQVSAVAHEKGDLFRKLIEIVAVPS
ncbi:MAG TPA: hypothetical protein VIJ62_03375 [Rhizomicrobium sp.]